MPTPASSPATAVRIARLKLKELLHQQQRSRILSGAGWRALVLAGLQAARVGRLLGRVGLAAKLRKVVFEMATDGG
eukprot:195863-Rhodomonas_salina.3